MSYKTLIIDDEIHCREYLSDLIEKFCPDLSIVGTAGTVQKAMCIISSEKPDLLFLDIHLSNESGFELLDNVSFNSEKTSVIFTTAYDQFAIKAFRYSAVDYLMKPVNVDELIESVNKFRNNTRSKEYKEIFGMLKKAANQTSFNKLCIPVNNGFQLIDTDTILYFKADGSYTTVSLEKKKALLVSKPLSFFEEIPDEKLFYRVHRSFLVNVTKIVAYDANEGYIELVNSEKIPVSNRKRKYVSNVFREMINNRQGF